jgi:plastocyanin domain-containing protein
MTTMKYLAALALSFVVTFGVTAGHAQAPGQEEKVQHVRLTVGDDGYVVTPSNVTKGVPVKMEVDLETVKGCARTVVISAFGVKKRVTTEDSTIEFVPDKTGTIAIACAMDMVKGSLTVIEQ